MEQPSDITSFERIPLDDVESPVLKRGVKSWKELRGTRRYPDFQALRPRDFASIMRHLMVVKVIDGGSDFEYRIVGEAHARTYALPFAGKRLSELRHTSEAYACALRGLMEYVVQFRDPVAVRGQLGTGFPNVRFVYTESAYLPLGATDAAVDHLLAFTAYS